MRGCGDAPSVWNVAALHSVHTGCAPSKGLCFIKTNLLVLMLFAVAVGPYSIVGAV